MTWPALLVLAAVAYTMKAAGPLLIGDRPLPRRANEVLGLIAVPLLAALIVVQTVTAGRHYVIDSRLAGLTVAAVAVWMRAPFIVVVLVAAVTGAGVHALTT